MAFKSSAQRKKVMALLKSKKFQGEWFKARFNRLPETDKAYFQEWQGRFKTGSPEAYMDIKSRKIFRVMLKKQTR